jgi:hypothetical protein
MAGVFIAALHELIAAADAGRFRHRSAVLGCTTTPINARVAPLSYWVRVEPLQRVWTQRGHGSPLPLHSNLICFELGLASF